MSKQPNPTTQPPPVERPKDNRPPGHPRPDTTRPARLTIDAVTLRPLAHIGVGLHQLVLCWRNDRMPHRADVVIRRRQRLLIPARTAPVTT